MAPIDSAFGLLAFAQRQFDRLISPQARSRAFDRVQAFAAARPLWFTFIVAQVLTSLLPIGLFLAFTISILVFSVGAALLFSLFWLGVALLFLIPALFMTISLGFLVFMWAVAARFAWFALPARIKSSITTGSTGSSKNHKGQNGYHEAYYPTYAAVAAAAAEKGAKNYSGEGEVPAHKASDSTPPKSPSKFDINGSSPLTEPIGMADLQKLREMKDGPVTP